MKNWRLRTKLTWWSALATGLALVTLGGIAAINVYREEIEEIDHRLTENSTLLFTDPAAIGDGDWSNPDRSAVVLKNAKSLYGFAIGPTSDSSPVWPSLQTGFPTGRWRGDWRMWPDRS